MFIVDLAIALIILYMGIWVFLLVGYWRSQALARSKFLTSWESNDYSTRVTNNGFEKVLRITFGHSQEEARFIDVDSDGNLRSDIGWENGSQKNTTPSRITRNTLEDITKQIATMYKLEHGEFGQDDYSGDATTAWSA